MRPIYNKVIGTCASVLMVSCQQDIPMVSLGVDSQYRIERMRKLILRPEFTGEAYRWTLKDSEGADSTVSTEREFIFVAEKPGTYALRLDIIDAQTSCDAGGGNQRGGGKRGLQPVYHGSV